MSLKSGSNRKGTPRRDNGLRSGYRLDYPKAKARTDWKSPILAAALLIAAASYLLLLAVPQLPPHLIDQCSDPRNRKDSASIVVVGVLTADTLVRSQVPMHSDPTYPLQLRRLTVRVENVLKGTPMPQRIDVYYFTWAGGYDGNRPLGFWDVGGASHLVAPKRLRHPAHGV